MTEVTDLNTEPTKATEGSRDGAGAGRTRWASQDRSKSAIRCLRWLRSSVSKPVNSMISLSPASLSPASLSPSSPINEPDSLEPRHTATRIELTRDELVILMTAPVELAAGAARIERHDQVVPMALEDRDRSLGLR